jgi:hypothetical protein
MALKEKILGSAISGAASKVGLASAAGIGAYGAYKKRVKQHGYYMDDFKSEVERRAKKYRRQWEDAGVSYENALWLGLIDIGYENNKRFFEIEGVKEAYAELLKHHKVSPKDISSHAKRRKMAGLSLKHMRTVEKDPLDFSYEAYNWPGKGSEQYKQEQAYDWPGNSKGTEETEWIPTTYKGKKYEFANTAEAQKLMKGFFTGHDKKFKALRKAGLIRERK